MAPFFSFFLFSCQSCLRRVFGPFSRGFCFSFFWFADRQRDRRRAHRVTRIPYEKKGTSRPPWHRITKEGKEKSASATSLSVVADLPIELWRLVSGGCGGIADTCLGATCRALHAESVTRVRHRMAAARLAVGAVVDRWQRHTAHWDNSPECGCRCWRRYEADGDGNAKEQHRAQCRVRGSRANRDLL